MLFKWQDLEKVNLMENYSSMLLSRRYKVKKNYTQLSAELIFIMLHKNAANTMQYKYLSTFSQI